MAKKAAIAVVMGVDDSYEQAQKKASDPKMTTKDNPLVDPVNPGPNPALVERNMDRLYQDAHMRRCPYNGAVYSGIMSTRYGG